MIEINNLTRHRIPVERIREATKKFLADNSRTEYSVSIAFIGDRRMTKLNYQYRQKNQTTDILSFAGEEKQLGELVINYQQIKRQARRYGHTVAEELLFILVHGLLHLIGYEDDTKKGELEMARRGEEFIKKLKNFNL